MKRHFLVVSAVLSASALVVASPEASADPPVRVGIAYDESGLGDFSFNDWIHQGAVAASDDFGVKLRELSQVKRNGQVLEGAVVLERLARGNRDLVIGNFTFEQAAFEVAARYPDTHFLILPNPRTQTPPNLKTVDFALNEGGFLAGVAAALTTSTGHVGFIGGAGIDAVLDALAGFEAGVSHIDPGIQISVEYVGSFGDPARAYELATQMYADGADVIWSVAGSGDIGVIEAARDASTGASGHNWAMGTDGEHTQLVSEDARPFVLLSIIGRLDVVVFDVIAAEVNGTFVGGNERYDLARNGLDYLPTEGAADIVPVLDSIRDLIVDGSIIVPTAP